MPGSESHGPARKSRNGVQDSSMSNFRSTALRLWKKSHAADYLGLIILVVGYVLLQLFVEPFHRLFYINDPRIQFPHAEIERVPVFWLFIYAAGVPFAIITLWLVVVRAEIQKVHVTLLNLAISILLTLFITDVIKNAVGRPRPDLMARCRPISGIPTDELSSIDVCQETEHHLLHDGWRSFPSGHSSFAFSGLGYLALFLASQLHVFRPRGDLARMIAVLVPILCAAMIAISRLEDYRHDVFDVVIGSLLGFSIAYSTWRRHYPSLAASTCATPYVVSAEGNVKGAFSRIRDEEEMIGNARDFDVGTD